MSEASARTFALRRCEAVNLSGKNIIHRTMEIECPSSALESVLRKELSTLPHRQTEALKKTPYIRVTAEEGASSRNGKNRTLRLIGHS
jgi:hypothetical protein